MYVRRLSIVILTAAAFAGCAPLPPLPGMPPSPTPAPAPAGSTITLGDAGGYQLQNYPLTVPPVCNADAYVAGYANAYALRWNQLQGPRRSMHLNRTRQAPADMAAAKNLALYEGKSFSLARYDALAAMYGTQHLASSDSNKRCAATAYQSGGNAGGQAAIEAFQRLVAQEAR